MYTILEEKPETTLKTWDFMGGYYENGFYGRTGSGFITSGQGRLKWSAVVNAVKKRL
jgi:hypothetical protein